MIRPLRRRHRVIIVGLSVLVPALFAAGLAVRRPVPEFDGPPPIWVAAERPEVFSRQMANLDGGGTVGVSWLASDASGRSRVVVEIADNESLPELLVYWTPSGGAGPEALPPTSVLLGPLRGSASDVLALPEAARADAPGRLLLYSLTRGEVLGAVDLRPPDGSGT